MENLKMKMKEKYKQRIKVFVNKKERQTRDEKMEWRRKKMFKYNFALIINTYPYTCKCLPF